MKVQSINSYYVKYSKNSRVQKPAYSYDKVSFGHAGMWDQFKLGILKKSDAEIKELAKYFHRSSEEELRKVCIIKNFFGFKKEEKSKEAYKRLSEAVKEAVQEKQSLELFAQMLKAKHSLTDYERRSLEDVNRKLADYNEKFEARESVYYIRENLLSEDDISYFNRHDNDYP